LRQGSTGRSSGVALLFYYDILERCMLNAGLWRANSWFGYEPGRKLARIWGSERDARQPGALAGLVANTIVLSGVGFSDESAEAFAGKMARFRPEFVEGYGSLLYLFCQTVRQRNLHLPNSIRAAFLSAEGLAQPQRACIEETLECPLYQRYGSLEFLAIAAERKDRQLHVFTDLLWLEIADGDGNRLPPGELGRILITCFHSRAFPFVRYDIQDMGMMSAEVYPCGSPYRVLKEVSGRTGGIPHLPDGRKLSGIAVLYQVRKLDRIGQVQLEQAASGTVRVSVVRGPLLSTGDFAQLQDTLAGFLGPQARLEYRFVGQVPRLASGKYELVRSSGGR
jgi:phenylacetate-CoA ligase